MLTYYHENQKIPLENTEYYIRELASGLDECNFVLPIHDPVYAVLAEEENIVDSDGMAYKVKQIDAGANDANVVCQIDLDAWRATLNVNYNSGTKTVEQQVDAVKPTGWTVQDRSGSTIGRTIQGDLTPYDVCVECTSVYQVYIRWNNKTKTVTIYPKAMGSPAGSFATRELNLKEINYKGKSNDLVTRLYAYGKDGLSFADINGGKAYVDNFTYTDRVICAVWRDERYTVKADLLADAQERLDRMAIPDRTYECSIVDLQATNPELYNNLDFSLFTAATLIDDIKNTAVDYQVVERHVYPFHPEQNAVIFNSEPLKITQSVINIAEQIENPQSEFQQVQKAKIDNATQWLTSGDGYVVARKDTDGTWKELLFMDTPDEATAQNVLRINTNGIGFSTTGVNGPYTNAWTIDGNLVADFVTTGTMLANRIKGGTLTLGGASNGDGSLSVKNASNTQIATINNSGITFNSSNFSVSNTGVMTCKGATIGGAITVGGASNTNGSITVKNASNSNICTINNNGISYGSGTFSVNSTGKLTATGASITGAITVGGASNTNGSITVKNASNSNICSIDKDGINYGNGVFKVSATGGLTATSASITGSLVSNGTGGAKVTISNGSVTSNAAMSCSGLTANTISANSISSSVYYSTSGGTTYTGATGQISWASADYTGHSLVVKNGIIVSML